MAGRLLPSGASLQETTNGGFLLPDGTSVLEAGSTVADVSGSATMGDISASGDLYGASDLSGSITLDDVSASGGVSSSPDGTLSGPATMGDIGASGTVAGASGVGTITTEAFKNWSSGLHPAGTTIPWVAILRCSDGLLILSLANQLLNGSSQLVISSGSLVPGERYQVAASNADGSACGMQPYVAA